MKCHDAKCDVTLIPFILIVISTWPSKSWSLRVNAIRSAQLDPLQDLMHGLQMNETHYVNDHGLFVVRACSGALRVSLIWPRMITVWKTDKFKTTLTVTLLWNTWNIISCSTVFR